MARWPEPPAVTRRAATRLLGGAAALVAGASASGCAQNHFIVAEGGKRRLSARDEVSGLSAIVTMGVWEGQPTDLPDDWTVLHLLVANGGREPVLLAPGDFAMQDLRGFPRALIDPGATFYVARDDLPAAGGYGRQYRRDYDPGGPTEFIPLDRGGDVGRLALPWGVLEPGTQMRGFLYFEPLVRTANGAQLTWYATTPEHEPVVDLQFDLWVARARTR